ncbi:ERF family protein [Cupriavidus oxalaticus]|uniref:ERF family protein n=1 Tax=Cupriavidus oxalaticus TaxID=96344 RepID=A0A976BFJ6_9BURK|nr:ERF family protein [Cupriavidus oxalaticus]QRQ86288.1 ERF family protein [Cupriavidus oxalaticus]QRQ95385.1 ERF family protein [Cupriavidus oxalaticus]WQD84039.1 ERF family protein [Cupriavidus oxalaticus]SPC17349.1 ERF family protein [Cupriavidus oxalaticus]
MNHAEIVPLTELTCQPIDMNLIPGPAPESLGQLFEALASAQGEFMPIAKNRTAHVIPEDSRKAPYSYDYSDMHEIREKTTPALSKHSLALMQIVTDKPNGGTHIRTIIAHKSAARVESSLSVVRGDADIKTFGATITILRRYIVAAMLNVAGEADLDESPDPNAGAGLSPVRPEVHTGMRDATSIGELSKVMSGLPKDERAKYNPYFEQRMQELRAAQEAA